MEKKQEKKVTGRSSKSKVMTILLGVSLFCMFSLFLLAIFNNDWVTGVTNRRRVAPKEQQKIEENKEENSDGDININFSTLEDDLLAVINEGNKVSLSHCTNCEAIDYDNSKEVICSEKELLNETVTKVVEKLKSAKKISYLPTSKPCAIYNYSIGNYLIVFESDDQKSLLVGLNGEGYAFDYDENVIPFFEELANMQ
ncbi:MAG: hypothetical protein J6X02_02395 [Bacilli bacterium]|nr:hypothetical protein [Bacilli bacterium]